VLDHDLESHPDPLDVALELWAGDSGGWHSREIDDAVAGLPRRFRFAVHTRWHGARWPFPPTELPEALQEARAELAGLLARRGVL
jgi:hypothetical protein